MLEWVIVLSLVIWRVTSLLYNEDIFGWLRRWFKIEESDDGDLLCPDNLIGAIWGCFWCLSLVVALVGAAAIVPLAQLGIWRGILLWLASAAGAIIIEKWIGRSKARW